MMHEVELRIATYEKRMNKDGLIPIEGGRMWTICTTLYNKFDLKLKKDVDREPPTEEKVDCRVVKTTECPADFEKI